MNNVDNVAINHRALPAYDGPTALSRISIARDTFFSS